MEPKGFMGYLERGNACELNTLNLLKIKNKLNFSNVHRKISIFRFKYDDFQRIINRNC